MVLKLWNYVNLLSIVTGSLLIAMLSGFLAYYLFKFLGFSGSFSDSIGFLAHYSAIFISATLLLKYAAEKGYAVFRVPRNLIFVAVPALVISLVLFASGNFLMIFPIDASLVMLAFVVAYRLIKWSDKRRR